MPRVLLIGHIHADGVDRLNALDRLEFEQIEDEQSPEIPAAVARSEAVLLRTAQLTPAMIDGAPELKVVSRHGVGYDNVPVERLNARKIPLAVAASANKISVAENALMMMLAMSKAALRYDREVRAGNWAVRNERASFELFGKNLLIVGFGRIGREVAKRAQAFAMKITVCDPYADKAEIKSLGYSAAGDLDTALADCDVVSLHLPKEASTANLLDARRLALLKPTAMVINTARGGLIDETALYEVLKSGQLAAAGLDVFAQEPAAKDLPLYGLDNVIVAPHSAGVTQESMVRMATESAQNIVDILQGRLDPAVIVNWDHLR